MAGFFTAPAIAWGAGALEQLGGLGSRRTYVLVDPAVARQEGPRRVVEELERAGAPVVVSSDLGGSARWETVGRLAEQLRGADVDWVVAIGGGTTIDAAKAARLVAERPELGEGAPRTELDLPERLRLRLAAVPTTSGSGAEVSWTADVVAPDGSPAELAHRALVPEWAIVDPLLARDLPVPTAVAGALGVAALATEAFLSAWANPFSDALAVEALRTVVRRVPKAFRWSDEPDGRAALHGAATEAGLAQSNAQRGLAHALARALVRPTGLAYARLLGIVLPTVLEFDRPSARERLDELAERLRLPGEPTVPSVAERLRRLAASAGAPTDLRAAGVDPAAVGAETERVVAETLRSSAVLANPRVPSAADVAALLDRLLAPGASPAGGPDRR